METIILGIILVGGTCIVAISPSIIKRVAHRPANGELKTLERIGLKVDRIAHHPAMKHAPLQLQSK